MLLTSAEQEVVMQGAEVRSPADCPLLVGPLPPPNSDDMSK